ncbi:unnamed protein product [Schistocephalus solidus]|uniref:G_PROTEIN_RECEP_F1_2 domain-containing protein n=1 Tax=Schistocephalus solidus TaxID=70667 RepID=A0A183TMZ6_SCHSO|nr:unnamed protein product [Schistocephalus solidus]
MSEMSCRILFAGLGVPTYVSCILMLLIAIDRYRSIIYPLRKRISTGCATFLLLASILFSVVAASPVAYFTGVQKVLLKLDSPEDGTYSSETTSQSTSSGEVYSSLSKTNANTQSRSLPPLVLRIERRNRRTNRILVSIVICFTVCWTPWTLYSLYLEYIAYSLTTSSRSRISAADADFGIASGPEFNQSTVNASIAKNLLRNQLQLTNANLKLTDIFLKVRRNGFSVIFPDR